MVCITTKETTVRLRLMPNTKRHQNSNITIPEKQPVLPKFLWLRHNFSYCLGLTALIWFFSLGYYIEHFIGWNSVLALTPSDFSSFLFSATFPLLAVWFILAYIERSSSLDANAELFQTYINSLMYPNEDASKNAKAIANVLKEQVQLLQKENKAIVTQSSQLKDDLEARLSELSNILSLLDTYSGKTLTELNEGVKTLADRCNYITDKTVNSIYNMRECTEDISQNSDKMLSKISPLLDEISAISSNIKNNIANNKTNLTEIKKQLENCADLSKKHIEDMLTQTANNNLRIEKSFYRAADEYDAMYKKLDISISGIEGRIEEQKRLLNTQTSVLNHNSDLLNNKMSKYGKTVSEEMEKLVKNSIELEKTTKKQITTLKTVNTETNKALNSIGGTIDNKREELERRCEYAINSMQNVIIAINKETEKLMSFTALTQAKNFDLKNIAETIVDKVGDISNKLALKTDALKDKAVEVIDKFTAAQDIITRSTEKLTQSSGQIVSNSQQSVKIMEEQNFYVTNTITNIDIVKDKLEKLNSEMQNTIKNISEPLAEYKKQLVQQAETSIPFLETEPEHLEIQEDEILKIGNHINRFIHGLNIHIETLFDKKDMFDLWDNYLAGNQTAFIDILSKTLSRKQINMIRKAFDDNADFHNLTIRFLFLMDIMIKKLLSTEIINKNELINLSVNHSLEKIYFILIKSLNNAE